MVEVFKTNVNSTEKAKDLIAYIHQLYPEYQANFDLTDCDKILRIYFSGEVNIDGLINIVKQQGFLASVLEDEIIAIAARHTNNHSESQWILSA
jgi:hypothetical protein